MRWDVAFDAGITLTVDLYRAFGRHVSHGIFVKCRFGFRLQDGLAHIEQDKDVRRGRPFPFGVVGVLRILRLGVHHLFLRNEESELPVGGLLSLDLESQGIRLPIVFHTHALVTLTSPGQSNFGFPGLVVLAGNFIHHRTRGVCPGNTANLHVRFDDHEVFSPWRNVRRRCRAPPGLAGLVEYIRFFDEADLLAGAVLDDDPGLSLLVDPVPSFLDQFLNRTRPLLMLRSIALSGDADHR